MSTGRYSKVNAESGPSELSDKQTVETFRPGVRLPVVVVCTLITACASVAGTYLATHSKSGDCASSGEVNAVSKKVDDLAATQAALTITVSKNADLAHNETQELRSTVTRNADRTDGGLQRLSDKLDLFMRR